MKIFAIKPRDLNLIFYYGRQIVFYSTELKHINGNIFDYASQFDAFHCSFVHIIVSQYSFTSYYKASSNNRGYVFLMNMVLIIFIFYNHTIK